jgi:hypothetical protein
MPDHVLINNHWSLATNWWVAALCIEGEEGWDKRVGEIGQRTVTAYVDAAISPDGIMSESVKPSLPPHALLAAARSSHCRPRLPGGRCRSTAALGLGVRR